MMQAFLNHWTAFWFAPSSPAKLTWIRRALALIVAIYFAAALIDVPTWFSRGAPASSSNLSTFFRTAELTGEARWMASPLFLWDAIIGESSLGESSLVYRCYLVIGILLAMLVAFADQLGRFKLPGFCVRIACSSWAGLLLWIWFVGWANRIVLLAGIVEPILSVSLAALAIAPVAAASERDSVTLSWRATLSRRLLAVQATLIGALTTATMLASPTWWNGTGAFALVAPEEDRFFPATGSFFETPLVYEMTTLLIVVLLPLGLFFAWKGSTRRIGIGLVWAWCLIVGILSANVLYAATLAIIATSIGFDEVNRTTAGANGA